MTLVFNETMSFEIQRMSFETSGRVVRLFESQVAKATNGQKNGSAKKSIIVGRSSAETTPSLYYQSLVGFTLAITLIGSASACWD